MRTKCLESLNYIGWRFFFSIPNSYPQSVEKTPKIQASKCFFLANWFVFWTVLGRIAIFRTGSTIPRWSWSMDRGSAIHFLFLRIVDRRSIFYFYGSRIMDRRSIFYFYGSDRFLDRRSIYSIHILIFLKKVKELVKSREKFCSQLRKINEKIIL